MKAAGPLFCDDCRLEEMFITRRSLSVKRIPVDIVLTNRIEYRSSCVEADETLLTSSSVGNILLNIIFALLVHGYPKLKHLVQMLHTGLPPLTPPPLAKKEL